MKKLSRQEIMHYVREKDFTPIDAYFAMWGINEQEASFFMNNRPMMQNLLIKARETIKTLLRWRRDIFDIANDLDKLVLNIYKYVRPESTASFFQNFYKEMATSKVNILFDIYGMKRKKIVHEDSEDHDILTDSDYE